MSLSVQTRCSLLADVPVFPSYFQFRATWNILLHKLPLCQQVVLLDINQKLVVLQDIRSLDTNLMWLAQLDPSLGEEQRFMADLDAGLEHGMLGGQLDTTAVWFHSKLMSSSEEGQQVDRARIANELSNISKFMGGSNRGGGSTAPARPPAPVQPVILNPHFGGQQQPPWNNTSVPGHYVQRKQALYNNCKKTGKSGADIAHSYRHCPLVECRKCHGYGHIAKNCRP